MTTRTMKWILVDLLDRKTFDGISHICSLGWTHCLAEIRPHAGAVLADQVKSLDWRIRKAKCKGAVSDEVLGEVRAKIKALLQIE